MAANTNAVTIKLKANGTDLDDPGLFSFAVTHLANGISCAELELMDGDVAKQDFVLSGDPNFAPGSKIEIEIGHGPDEMFPIFKGIIVRNQIKAKSKSSSQLFIEAKDEAVKMTHIRKTRHFLDKKDSDIIETLIGDSGLEKEVDSDFKAQHERMIQYHMSDWDFMLLRAEANGKLVYTDAGKVIVAKPKVKESGAPKATFGDNVYEFETEMESRDQYSGGSATAWDHSSQAMLLKDAEANADIEEGGDPKASKLASDLSDGKFTLRHPGEITDNELIAWSSGKLQRSLLSKIRGRVQLDGDATLKPGGTLLLEGMGKVFNGPAFISGVRHHVQQGRWHSDVELGMCEESYAIERPEIFEAPASGLLGPMRGLQIGVVKEIKDDPQSFFRVQVKLQTIDDPEDGIWCRVARPDAGASHTVFWQPIVGDEVVVGFLNEDPRHAIVLGSLHNTDANKPPIEDNDEFKKRGIVTPEGLKLTFDDKDKIVILETPKGKKITVDEKEGVIRLEDENKNKIEMSKDGITIESGKDIILKATGDVKVEGVNIEQAASAQFKAEGSGGIEVSSSANAVVKGAMVQIN